MFKLLSSTALANAFVNTNAASKLYISDAPVPDDLDQTGFEALTWVEVGAVGSFGETGSNTNILTYDTWNTDVIQKGKGITDAGSPDVETARLPDDPGQVLMRQAGAGNFNWGFKVERNDKPNNDAGSTPTIRYNRGLVTGPRQPNGRNEDFDLEVYTLGLQQRQIQVDPVDGSA